MRNFVGKFRNLSIKRKLIISFSVIVVFPLITSLLLSNNIVTNFMLDEIASLNETSINDSSKVLNRTLDDMAYTLLNISNNSRVRELLQDDNVNYKIQFSKIQRYVKQKKFDDIFDNIPISLMTYNTSITILGEKHFDYGNWEEYSRYTKEMKQNAWYKEIIKSKDMRIRWIGVMPGVENKDNYFFEAAMPIKISNSSLTRVGVVHIRINEKDIYKALSSNNETNEIYLLQHNGEILSCKNKDEISKNINNRLNVTKINENLGKSYIDVDKNGKKIVINSVSIDKGDWILISLVSYEELVAPLTSIKNILLLINLIFMVSFLIVALFISNIISKPIIKLRMSMLKVESGDFNGKVEVQSEDEIGKLSQNFNNMLDRVSELLVLTKEQERLKRDAEFEALQAQINPHFLFNTLSSIRWAAAAYGDKKVEDMVHALSILLRASITNGQEMVSLESEINILKNYLDLIQMKQGTTIIFECNIDESIMKYRIPHLLLQPIVENSILHGFEDRNEQGVIRITAIAAEDLLKIELTDNGKGLQGDTLDSILNRESQALDDKKYYKSVGLKNIHDRLKLIYGQNYGIDICDGEKNGTKVTLYMPFQKGGEHIADSNAGR
ncbi:Histidine kinase-, DNA gyrase B-, and HSP90-like ATPase [Anaerocolumna jejuensis DSM 15929]|uniref:Histidine kinase-, DNA gyrase B-, and HSP90-like ATPase n=1 Tax=Anaerocolumna jejuensis DSM 15929 TaxID=1121322 RepID=A0A1M6ZAY8_9FIRM|nr:sensor histidine kinase [Anaerocolumna jejuensis]SHL27628.1 Histidine kinase-, DNA gyrase B-, and HSP90-like ATPase [Anaerocolumna jejuensis DSM 15929]